ncbi:MAG: hypothetical protein WC364_13390 [Eubacteriales bacterium]|jgi:hypothetical protein
MARSPFLIKIPSGLKPWEADNWRAVAEALKMALSTTNAVDSPTTGLSAVQGKVRVDQYDTTPEYLDQKIVEGSDIDFVKSNDGMGAKEIKANFKLVVSASEPTTITEGMLWFDTDARFGTPHTIGDGEADIDYELKFDGETNDGSLYWMEDEDYFKLVDDLLINSNEKIMFRDTAISINSADDGHLDLTADVSIDLNTAADTDLVINLAGTTNSGVLTWMEDEDYLKIGDGVLMDMAEEIFFRDTAVGINSANDGYLDLFADTGVRTSKAIRGTTSLFRRYYHVALGAANPGASGPTWVVAGSNTTGGWRLTNASWLLRGQADIHADWDGATDLTVSVNFMVNINNTGGLVTDTVDLRLNAYYKGVGDVATKTQAVEVATVVGQSPQYKQFKATFTIDWDALSNVVEVGDVISLILNLETDTSEVDDIVVTSMEFYYQTAHIGIESGDI